MRSRPVASSGVKGSPEASVPRPISFVQIDFVTAPSWFLLVLAQRKARRAREDGLLPALLYTAGLSGCSFAPITVTIGELPQPQQPSFDVSAGVGDIEVLRPLAAVAADVPRSVDGPAEQRQTITRPGPAPHPAYRPTRPKLPAAAALSLSAGP